MKKLSQELQGFKRKVKKTAPPMSKAPENEYPTKPKTENDALNDSERKFIEDHISKMDDNQRSGIFPII
jgi:hypothetical protein